MVSSGSENFAGLSQDAHHVVYVYGVTVLSFVGIYAVCLRGLDTELARRAVDGLVGLLEAVSTFFIGSSVIDRSNVLSLVGRRIANGPRPPE